MEFRRRNSSDPPWFLKYNSNLKASSCILPVVTKIFSNSLKLTPSADSNERLVPSSFPSDCDHNKSTKTLDRSIDHHGIHFNSFTPAGYDCQSSAVTDVSCLVVGRDQTRRIGMVRRGDVGAQRTVPWSQSGFCVDWESVVGQEVVGVAVRGRDNVFVGRDVKIWAESGEKLKAGRVWGQLAVSQFLSGPRVQSTSPGSD